MAAPWYKSSTACTQTFMLNTLRDLKQVWQKLAALSPVSKAYIALMVIYVVWGTTLGSSKIGLAEIPTAPFIAMRYLGGGLLLLLVCLLKGENLPLPRLMGRDLLVGFLVFFAGNTAIYWAVQYIPTAIAGLIIATTPFWLTAMSAIWLKEERITPAIWAGLGLGFLGIGLLMLPELMAGDSSSATLSLSSPMVWMSLLGMMLMNVFWALGGVYAKRVASPFSLLMSVSVQNLFAGLLMVVVMVCMPPQTVFMSLGGEAILRDAFHLPSIQAWLCLLYLVVLGTATATPCYFFALKHLPMSLMATCTYVAPMITLLVGVTFFQEQLSSLAYVSAGLIVLGVFVVQREVSMQKERPAKEKQPFPVADVPGMNAGEAVAQYHREETHMISFPNPVSFSPVAAVAPKI